MYNHVIIFLTVYSNTCITIMTYNVCVLLLVCPHFLKLISHLPTCTCTVYILLAVHFCSENIYICYLNKKVTSVFKVKYLDFWWLNVSKTVDKKKVTKESFSVVPQVKILSFFLYFMCLEMQFMIVLRVL
jgi:hypothetical protein